MNNKVITSTPGKLMLMGEHAVVHGRGCLVTAVDQRLQVTITPTNETGQLTINAPDVQIENFSYDLRSDTGIGVLPKAVQFVVQAVKNFQNDHPFQDGLQIDTASEFKSTFGFGSSSAVTVGTLAGLAALFDVKLSKQELFTVAYQTVIDVQGVGSGFDLASAIWGGLIYFETGGKVIEPLQVDELPLVVGYTGIKADTVTLVKRVNQRQENLPKVMNTIFDLSWELVLQGKEACLRQDWKLLGQHMDVHQGLSSAMGVNGVQLERQIHAAREAGAWGAKLSGAGGGDCMLALVNADNRPQVENAIDQVGGQVLDVALLAPGVKVEEYVN